MTCPTVLWLAVPEVWRPIPSAPRYQVSTWGRVRSGARVLRPQQQTKGYLKLHLGRHRQALVHTLVAEAWLGPRPPGHEVDHLDHDRRNNSLENLRYLRAYENAVRWAGRHPAVRARRRASRRRLGPAQHHDRRSRPGCRRHPHREDRPVSTTSPPPTHPCCLRRAGAVAELHAALDVARDTLLTAVARQEITTAVRAEHRRALTALHEYLWPDPWAAPPITPEDPTPVWCYELGHGWVEDSEPEWSPSAFYEPHPAPLRQRLADLIDQLS